MNGRAADLARRWWGGELGAAGTALDVALAPAEAAYRLGTALRNAAYDRGVLRSASADIPVISIGNIAIGGTGKTPFTRWLAERLEARGETPAIVHGGYAPDEPQLHRTWTPHIVVVVDRDRLRAARTAHGGGASVVVLDDAFQHRRLRRDLDIVLVAVERWAGAARLLPRGGWRESPAALRRASLIVCVRKTAVPDDSATLAALLRERTGRPVMRVHLRATAWQHAAATAVPAEPNAVAPAAPSEPSLLVAGLADPALFAANVRAAGVDIAGELLFPDHHDYDEADIDRIRAAAAGRTIVTTEKDRVKLHGRIDPMQLWVLTQELEIEEGESLLDAALDRVLK